LTKILPFPSCRLPRERSTCGVERPAPQRHGVEVVRLHGAVGDEEDALQDLGAGHNRITRPLNLTDVRLAAAKLGRKLFLRLSFALTPLRELHRQPLFNGLYGYWDGLYFVNGHKHVEGAEYKQMAYILAMHPGNRIRELRKAAGLSQVELAQRTGVSQPYISQIENQDALSLDVARMRVLSREFGCAPADLLSDSDNPDRLSPEERALIANFRSADAAQRALIQRVAEPIVLPQASERRAA
jgi:transcriptional regulator with XRE-family HTH domain